MPIFMKMNAMSLFRNQVLSCGGETSSNCYIYFPRNNTWSLYASGYKNGYYTSNAVYKGKIYLSVADSATPQAEVFDPVTLTWTPSWPISPDVSYLGCLVQWEDSFIRFGGDGNKHEILQYNITLQTWTSLNSTMPRNIYNSGCAVMPNKQILLMGSLPGYYNYTVYDVPTNSWPIFSHQNYITYESSVLVLSDRVFILVAAGEDVVQEYLYKNDIFSQLPIKLITQRTRYPGVLSVPAKLFSHLPGGCIGIK